MLFIRHWALLASHTCAVGLFIGLLQMQKSTF